MSETQAHTKTKTNTLSIFLPFASNKHPSFVASGQNKQKMLLLRLRLQLEAKMAEVWKRSFGEEEFFFIHVFLEVHRDATARDEILTSWEWFKIAEKERERECVCAGAWVRERESEGEKWFQNFSAKQAVESLTQWTQFKPHPRLHKSSRICKRKILRGLFDKFRCDIVLKI